jgi:hypothetical protein
LDFVVITPGIPSASAETNQELSRSPRSEQTQYLSQPLANVLNLGGGVCRERNGGLSLVSFGFRAQVLARALDGESLLVE